MKIKEIKMKVKGGLRKYRSTIIMGAFLMLNVAESAYYGTPFLTVNESAESVGEMLWDNICSMGMFFAIFMAAYDLIQANAQFQYAVKKANVKER